MGSLILGPAARNVSNGTGDGGTIIVATVAALGGISPVVQDQLVGVQETGTLWKYDPGNPLANEDGFVDTGDNYANYYGGQVAETRVNVYLQRTQTPQQLIDKFGVVSEYIISVDQTQVDYTTLGVYPVTFNFSQGRSITVKISIVTLLVFEEAPIKEFTKVIANPINFIDLYNLGMDFSNYTVQLNGATSPIITGNKHEWIKRPLTDIDKVELFFTNMATMRNGKTLNCRVSFINYDVYSYNPVNQKWGFDIQSGNIIFKQAGFINFEVKFEFTEQDENIVYLNMATRIDNVEYAKHVGSEAETSEFFVSDDTLLKGVEFEHPNSTIPVFVASRFDGGAAAGADNVALGIAKQNTSSFTLVFGKDYTGDINFDLSITDYLDLPVTMRFNELEKVLPKETVFRQNITTTPVSVGGLANLVVIPPGILKNGKKYEIIASAKYTRSSGGTTPSNVGFRLIQGIVNKIEDVVTVERDATTSLSMNIPQIIDRYTFNETENVVAQVYIPTGQQAVTMNQFKIRLTEVDEVEL